MLAAQQAQQGAAALMRERLIAWYKGHESNAIEEAFKEEARGFGAAATVLRNVANAHRDAAQDIGRTPLPFAASVLAVIEAARNAERVLSDRIEFDVPCWMCKGDGGSDTCPASSPRDGCPHHARDRLQKSLAALDAEKSNG